MFSGVINDMTAIVQLYLYEFSHFFKVKELYVPMPSM